MTNIYVCGQRFDTYAAYRAHVSKCERCTRIEKMQGKQFADALYDKVKHLLPNKSENK